MAQEGTAPRSVVERTVPRGVDDRAGDVWALKERIREREGVLVQRRPFFEALYRDARCHLALSPATGDVVGFALARRDGYLSLLGVALAFRRRGVGSGLLARVASEHDEVTCHVRATNEPALSFYTDHGFLVDRLVPGYYRDGTDAYLLGRDPDRAAGIEDLLERRDRAGGRNRVDARDRDDWCDRDDGRDRDDRRVLW